MWYVGVEGRKSKLLHVHIHVCGCQKHMHNIHVIRTHPDPSACKVHSESSVSLFFFQCTPLDVEEHELSSVHLPLKYTVVHSITIFPQSCRHLPYCLSSSHVSSFSLFPRKDKVSDSSNTSTNLSNAEVPRFLMTISSSFA